MRMTQALIDKLRSTLANYAIEIVASDNPHYLCGVCGAKTAVTEIIEAIRNTEPWKYRHETDCLLHEAGVVALPTDYVPETSKDYQLLDRTVVVDDVSGRVMSCEDKESGFRFDADIDQFRKFASIVQG
jgi:hypothetical protein